MSKASIKLEINTLVEGDHSLWFVGVTANPSERRTAHGNPKKWYQWQTDSDEESREIKQEFVDLGMDGGPGGPKNRVVSLHF